MLIHKDIEDIFLEKPTFQEPELKELPYHYAQFFLILSF